MDMKSTWKGFLAFGLIHVPVSQYAGLDSKGNGKISFRLLHDKCMKPVKRSDRCPNCDVALESKDIVHGYELQAGVFVKIADADIDAAALDGSAKALQIVKFVKAGSVDPMYFDNLNLLGPGDGSSVYYMGVHQAMVAAKVDGIARQVMRGSDYTWLVRPLPKGVLALMQLRTAEQVRTQFVEAIQDELKRKATSGYPTKGEVEMAVQYIKLNMGEFDPAEFGDRRQAALAKLVEAAKKGKKPKLVPVKEPEPTLGTMMDALKASVRQAQRRGVAA